MVTAFIIAMRMSLGLGLTLKFILFSILFASYFETSRREKLIFYKNFGISRILLFSFSFLIDAALTTILVLIADIF